MLTCCDINVDVYVALYPIIICSIPYNFAPAPVLSPGVGIPFRLYSLKQTFAVLEIEKYFSLPSFWKKCFQEHVWTHV